MDNNLQEMIDDAKLFCEDEKLEDWGNSIARQVAGEEIGGFEAVYHNRSGSVTWNLELPNGEYIRIGATPFWEGQDGIPFHITDDDDNDIYDEVVPFKPTMKIKQDVKTYLEIVKKIIDKIDVEDDHIEII